MFDREIILTTPESDIDSAIGEQIRLRRVMLGLSQSELSVPLQITFQQLQKYEKGRVNRVSGSRLVQIAAVLKCDIESFFVTVPGQDGRKASSTPITTREVRHLDIYRNLSTDKQNALNYVARVL